LTLLIELTDSRPTLSVFSDTHLTEILFILQDSHKHS